MYIFKILNILFKREVFLSPIMLIIELLYCKLKVYIYNISLTIEQASVLMQDKCDLT